MPIELWLVKGIGQHGNNFLLNLHKVCPVELVRESRFLSQSERKHVIDQTYIYNAIMRAKNETLRFKNLKLFQQHK